MQYSFGQVVYNCDGSDYNIPKTLTQSTVNGELLNYTPAYQLGIRALPGTKIYLNGSSTPIIIGFNGMFEIDFTKFGSGSITSLRVDEDSLTTINANDSAYLIIDFMFLKGGD